MFRECSLDFVETLAACEGVSFFQLPPVSICVVVVILIGIVLISFQGSRACGQFWRSFVWQADREIGVLRPRLECSCSRAGTQLAGGHCTFHKRPRSVECFCHLATEKGDYELDRQNVIKESVSIRHGVMIYQKVPLDRYISYSSDL